MNRVNSWPASNAHSNAGRISTAVVIAVADAVDEDPTELRSRLYDSIDPDALDAIFRPKYDGTPRTGGHISFTLHEYEITVYSDGGVSIFNLHDDQENQTPILTSWAEGGRTATDASTHGADERDE